MERLRCPPDPPPAFGVLPYLGRHVVRPLAQAGDLVGDADRLAADPAFAVDLASFALLEAGQLPLWLGDRPPDHQLTGGRGHGLLGGRGRTRVDALPRRLPRRPRGREPRDRCSGSIRRTVVSHAPHRRREHDPDGDAGRHAHGDHVGSAGRLVLRRLVLPHRGKVRRPPARLGMSGPPRSALCSGLPSGQDPVDRLTALLGQQGVGPTERPGPEEAAVGRHRARMR